MGISNSNGECSGDWWAVDLAKSDPGPFLDPNPKEKYGYGYGYRFFDPGTKMVSTRTRPVKRWVGLGQPAGHMGRPVFFFFFFFPRSLHYYVRN